MGKTYTKTLLETTAAMSLIPKLAGVLAGAPVRYLHRGVHPVRTAIHLLRLLVFGLSIPVVADSS